MWRKVSKIIGKIHHCSEKFDSILQIFNLKIKFIVNQYDQRRENYGHDA